jgi:hypothetical protein
MINIMVKVKSIYYGGNINIVKKDKKAKKDETDETDSIMNIFTLYDNIPVNCFMDKEYTESINPLPVIGTFFSKSVSYQDLKEKNVKRVFSMPPKGPMQQHTVCPFCDNEGPQYHTEDCTGPYDYNFLTKDGFLFYANKINSTFSGEQLREIIDEQGMIYYKDIYPNRGVQKIISEDIRSHNFSNVLQLKYSLKNDDGEGIIVPIKITPSYGITARNVPWVETNTFDTFSRFLHESLIVKWGEVEGRKYETINTWITNINGIFNLCGDNENIDLGQVYTVISNSPKETTNYNIYDYINSSLKGFVSVKFAWKVLDKDKEKIKIKVSATIRSGGSVTVFLSYGSTAADKSNGITLLDSPDKQLLGKDLLVEVCNIIYKDMFKGTNFCIAKQEHKGVHQDTKIMNMSIPYKIEDNKFKYDMNFKVSKFPPQPSGCQNKGLTSSSTLVKSNIRRPVPFSFSRGVAPTHGMVIKREGIKSSGVKLIGDRINMVEPCCELVSGTVKDTTFIKNVVYSKLGNLINESKLETLVDTKSLTNKPELLLKELNKYIGGLSGVREKMFRRTMFGFPNNLYSEDSAEANGIQEGIEHAPDFDKGATLINQTDKIRCIKQQDSNSIVYVPGTQLEHFGGNGTLVRDSRCFPGLMKFSKDEGFLRFVVDRYLSTLVIENKEYLPATQPQIENMINGGDCHTITIPTNSQFQRIKSSNGITFSGYIVGEKFYVVDNDFVGNYEERRKNKYDDTRCVVYPTKAKRESIEIEDGHTLIVICEKGIFEYGKTPSWYFKNAILEIEVEMDNPIANLIKLKLPKNVKANITLMTYNREDGYLFVPTKVYKTITRSGVYKFQFNYYQDSDLFYKLVPNQPFILFNEGYKVPEREQSLDYTTAVFDYILS